MLQVKRIGHATLTTPDLERQLDYYTRVVGLSILAKEKGRAILATKPGQEAIVLEHGERPAGVRLAFQVAPGSDLGELSARLSKAGIKSERRSGITPGIAQAIVFTDPKGTSVEIFSDYTFAKDDDSYTGVMPRKLGHVAFHTPDVAATLKFYCDVLGFKVSNWRIDFFAFLRCSRDHHTINLLQADNANIHHLAFELRDEAEINRACDFLARKNIKLFWGPIRHLFGHNIAIYHKNPDGITVEFFTDIDLMFDEELAISSRGRGIRTARSGRRCGATTRRRTIGGRDTRTTCRGRRSDGARRSSFAGPHARADGRLRSAAFRIAASARAHFDRIASRFHICHGRSYAVALLSWASFCSSPSMKVIGPPIAIAWAS